MSIQGYFKKREYHNKANMQLQIKVYTMGVKLSEQGLRAENSDFSPFLLSLGSLIPLVDFSLGCLQDSAILSCPEGIDLREFPIYPPLGSFTK